MPSIIITGKTRQKIISLTINIFLKIWVFTHTHTHTHRTVPPFTRFAIVNRIFKMHPEYLKQISKSPGSLPWHISFRLLLVRACKFIIRDPPRIRATSERWGQTPASYIHPPTVGTMQCMHACVRACIASVVLIHARMHIYTWDRATKCITLLIEYRPLLGRMFPPVSVGVYYAPGTPTYHTRYTGHCWFYACVTDNSFVARWLHRRYSRSRVPWLPDNARDYAREIQFLHAALLIFHFNWKRAMTVYRSLSV